MQAEMVLFGRIDLCLSSGYRLFPSFTCSNVIFSLLSLSSASVLSSMSHFIVPHPLRHRNNNYFLNAYRHIWLEIMHENADCGSLLSMLTVMLCSANVTTVWPSTSFLTAPCSPPDMVYNTDLIPIQIFLLGFPLVPCCTISNNLQQVLLKEYNIGNILNCFFAKRRFHVCMLMNPDLTGN